MTATTTSTTRTLSRSPRKSLASRGAGIATASTPNLNALYSAQSRLAPPSLSRKASFAALTSNTLATIPDVSETYAFNTLNDTPPSASASASASTRKMAPAPLTPARQMGDGLALGDTVDVPGSMFGTVRFIGTVAGRKGTFAGVELSQEFASRGKNNGDVDGVFYFTTSAPGAGIFLPLAKAVRRESPPTSASSFPLTPTNGAGLKVGNQNSTNFTPPTPSLSKFSQSVGPGRAPSPSGRRPRTSLPRPDSPVRRLQTPASRPSIATPAPKVTSRFGSPTANKFSQSVRGTVGDPSKKGWKTERKASIGPRSASALGGSSVLTDDETTPVGNGRSHGRAKANGSVSSVSSFNMKIRPGSRADNDEVVRLRGQLEDRDRQLRVQAATLADMEGSLTELQTLIELQPDGPGAPLHGGGGGGMDDPDAGQLRALVREKNDKIALLTAEFDQHRADFRSTIDTLEMASTETERVYEKRIEELMQELQDIEGRTSDVDAVAQQLKQLEELVQELEEGLEDARRGEAEARGEVEFLRGEVERTRSELRREREKAAAALNGGPAVGDRNSVSKELEQKEDEIRGLKAIIHSLSRDAVPTDSPEKTPNNRPGSFRSTHRRNESMSDRLAREKLEREVADLRSVLDAKNTREDEMEREIEQLRRGTATTHRVSAMTVGSTNRSSLRDSRGTVVLAREYEPHSPDNSRKTHNRGPTLDTMPESDAYSSVTESSTLWCEICETNGHDILTCTNMFGPQGDSPPPAPTTQNGTADSSKTGRDVVREGLRGLSPLPATPETLAPPPLSPVKTKSPSSAVPREVKILPNPMDSGPVAGKESGVVDAEKWCALCERDGHDSVDCPFEDAF